jgi:hypothetical protein
MNFYRKILFGGIFLAKFSIANGQFGGWASYSFLKLAPDAHVTGLGGQNVAIISDDPSHYLNNPALNQIDKKHYLKINFAPLWAGSTSTTISYGSKLTKLGSFSSSLQYLNFGSFQGADPSGNLTETFRANDFSLTIGNAQKVNNITIGANVKLVGSTIETYSALAILVDFGGYFKHPNKDLSYGLAIKNMGARLKNFNLNDTQQLPFDVQMGISFRPEQMPFRFSLNAHHLHQWDILNDKLEQKNSLNNQPTSVKYSFGDKLASHFIVGIEALVQENFQLNFGYNRLLRNELKLDNQFTLAGFSAGILMKTKKINLGIGSQGVHPARGITQISIFKNLK